MSAGWVSIDRGGTRRSWGSAPVPRVGDTVECGHGRCVVIDIHAGPKSKAIYVRPALTVEEEARLAGQLLLW